MTLLESIFIKSIDNRFRKKITKESIVPHSKPLIKKGDFLKELFKKLKNKQYFVSNPRNFIIIDKGNLVSRIIPTFIVEDNCIYYYCIKTLEPYIAKNRIEGTYGWFSMWWEIRKKESEECKELENNIPSLPLNPLNSLARKEAWRDFQKKAYSRIDRSKYVYFVDFDIANFYDTINISLLEKKLYTAINQHDYDIVNLLLFFLKNQNREFIWYEHKTVGLPQDEFWKPSRILANFFLQEYDKKIHDESKNLNAQYLRYADDQLIYAPSQETTQKLLYFASKELHKIWLNINASKVRCFDSVDSFEQYWAFEIFNLLGDPSNTVNIERAVDLYIDRKNKNAHFRSSSVLSRLIYCDINKINVRKKANIMSEILDESFLKKCTYRQLEKIHNLFDVSDRESFLKNLMDLWSRILHNAYHYQLLSLSQKITSPTLNQKIINQYIISHQPY